MEGKILDKSIASFLESTDFKISGAQDFVYEIKESDISMHDIILNSESKKKIEQVILEHKNIAKLKNFKGLKPTNKIILEGESGCGKTSSALAIAQSLNKGIIIVNLSEIISSKLGETSRNLNKIFKYAEANNYIIFFDEFDSLSKSRSDEKELGEMKRLVNSIIQLLDFGTDNLIVIGATNYIQNLDSAIRRRFEALVHFPKPDEKQIKQYILMMEFNYEGKVKISSSKQTIGKLLGLDFFRIKTIINSIIKDKVINSSEDIIKIKTQDINI